MGRKSPKPRAGRQSLPTEESTHHEGAATSEVTESSTHAHRTTHKSSLWRTLDPSLIGTLLAIKALILIFGVISFVVLENQPIQGHLGWLKIWNRWDALSYQSLAQNGYQATGEARFTLAFLPLYPWLIRLLASLGGNYLISAIVVSTIASVAAGVLLQRLARLELSPALARRSALFLFIFPTSYFLHIGYTESLFLALVVGCFLAARTKRWPLAGALGLLAGLTRINSLILLPALAIEALQQWQETRRRRWEWLWIGAVALGFGGYLLLNFYVTGDALAFMKIQQGNFFKSLTWPWVGLRGPFFAMWDRAPAESQMVGVQESFFILLGLVGTIWCWAKQRPAYGVWMTGNWLLFTCTSFVLSVPRYTLVMFPLYILFAKLSARHFWNAVITVWSLLFLALFINLFVRGRWAF